MKRDKDAAHAWRVVAEVYERCKNQNEVSPAWLATQVMIEIEANREANELEYLFAHLQIRQIGREFCRKKFDGDTPEIKDDFFPETLQPRYPKKPDDMDEEPVYILRDLMSDEDIAYNVARLRREANAKQAHADALEAWGKTRKAVA